MSSDGVRTIDSPADEVVIELDHAAFGYGERAVLRDASLTVHRGEIVAVVGPNGSGKSTLMKGILGLNEQVSGSVRLFGVAGEDLHERARLGYVPQRHTLSASVRATAEEIVSTGRLPRIGWLGRLRATDRQLVARSLDVVGLADRAATEVSTLSGGQQRRVLIARALAGQPDVLIMDEPTAGVDAANQHVLADVLDRLVQRGVTMLIVTHELGALERLLTRIVVVDTGRITFDGTPREYAAARDRVHHDHDSHHHDSELDAYAVVTRGPLDADHTDHHREARP
ncbi:metal ABC transporter ATP-binding protein [Terrabacter sp. NPDC080008]|uniref:metal ABC transporter ATP-binding protein n=1 Tax=Terrabacter sp. NPDC080008 TaxID=3155176 RepID=UPI00344E48DC